MNNYSYTLEPYKGSSTRHTCPECNKEGQFTRYIHIDTKEYVDNSVGMCNRKDKCAYHYPPKEYFQDNDLPFRKRKIKYSKQKKTIIETSFIDSDIFFKSIESKDPNFFIEYLTSLFGKAKTTELIKQYNIGTSTLWKGSTVFWQMDVNRRIRTGKIMLYNNSTGKRVKAPYNHINWTHKTSRLKDFNLKQCYYGEHLLNEDPNKPVAIVESEKTAIICSAYLPDFIWIACGSVNNLNKAKTKVLKGRNVVLFPDLGCSQLWSDKIKSLTQLTTFRVSNLLEKKASIEEKSKGLDLADFLIKYQLDEFTNELW